MAKPENFLTACDIGSSKICVLIGEQNAHGALDVIGKGASPNRGTRKGNINNVDATIEAIKRAAEEAEIMAGVQIARAHEVVHVVPREFAVDGQDGVDDPTGMVGARLEADVHVVTAPVAVTQNIVTCMNKAGIEVVELILEQFAAAEAVLTEDEKELGIVLIDIGGGTTEVAVYQKGSIAHTAVIPVGGDHFTNDLAVVLRAPIGDAERIKRKFGSALRSAVGDDEMVEVAMVGGREPKLCPRSGLADVVSRPEWATATGLLLYGHRHKRPRRRTRGISRAATSFSRFFRELF